MKKWTKWLQARPDVVRDTMERIMWLPASGQIEFQASTRVWSRNQSYDRHCLPVYSEGSCLCSL